jgi:uncharacterized protein
VDDVTLTHTFQANGAVFCYNAVNSKFYRVDSIDALTAVPTDAEFAFDYPEPQIRAHLAAGPKMLTLNVTEQCNLRCRYCVFSGNYKFERAHNDARMSQAVAERAVDLYMQRAPDQTSPYVGFYGGEPFIAFDLIQHVVAYAREKYPDRQFRFGLTTNATLMKPAVAQFVAREKFNLAVSLDGPESVHDAQRVFIAQSGTWQTVMEHLQYLYDYDPEYYRANVGFICTMRDVTRLPEIHAFFTTHPLVHHHALVLNKVSEADIDLASVQPLTSAQQAQVDEFLAQFEQKYIDDVVNRPAEIDPVAQALFGNLIVGVYRRGVEPLTGARMPSGMCVPGATKMFVTTSGELGTCEKIGNAFPLGDVEHGLNEEASIKLVQEQVALCRAECEHCWAIRFCTACLVAARQGSRLSLDRQRKSCAHIRQQLERALRIYVSVTQRDRSAWKRYLALQRDNPIAKLVE